MLNVFLPISNIIFDYQFTFVLEITFMTIVTEHFV